jgi:hypothetical protein
MCAGSCKLHAHTRMRTPCTHPHASAAHRWRTPCTRDGSLGAPLPTCVPARIDPRAVMEEQLGLLRKLASELGAAHAGGDAANAAKALASRGSLHLLRLRSENKALAHRTEDLMGETAKAKAALEADDLVLQVSDPGATLGKWATLGRPWAGLQVGDLLAAGGRPWAGMQVGDPGATLGRWATLRRPWGGCGPDATAKRGMAWAP